MNYWKLSGYFLVACLVLLSCRKTTTIGIGILPPETDINASFTDTFKVITTPMREDSVATSSQFVNLLGNMFDPVFGKTYASIFTEFALPTTDVDFGNPDTLFLDSVVLTLAYSGAYGYEDVPQSISVYEIAERMSPQPDIGYFSNKSFASYPELLGRKQLVVPNLKDSVDVAGVPFPPHLRIRLSDRFGQELLNQSGTDNFKSDSAFKSFFNGLLIAPDTVGTPYSASLMYLAMLTSTTGLRLYWHSPKRNALTFTFPLGTEEVKTNYYKHNYNGSVVQSHLQNEAPEGDSLIFLQSMAGIKTRVIIPDLLNLHDVVINKAEMVISQRLDPNRADSVFTPPVQILIVTLDSAGKYAVLPDQNQPFPVYGGNKTTVGILPGDTVAEYTFSISNQVQLLIDGKITDYGLFLLPNKPAETADRLMAGGGTREDVYKIKLNIVYTPIE